MVGAIATKERLWTRRSRVTNKYVNAMRCLKS